MGRLKGISPLISPQLLHALASMGHGDEIVLADANFPTCSVCKQGGAQEIRADGHDIADLLEAILTLMPLDAHVWSPAMVMDVEESDRSRFDSGEPPVWEDYRKIICDAEGREIFLMKIERFDFYERAKKAFAVVHTGEMSLYGNIILKMGIIPP